MDEPFLDLGKSYQSQQEEIDNSQEAWEMHEFLTPQLQEMGGEREMLVDEEYELYQDQFQSMELYTSSNAQEATPVPSRQELHFGTQWLHDSHSDGELPEARNAGPMMNMYAQGTQQYSYSPEHTVRHCDSAPTSSPLHPPHLSLTHIAVKNKKNETKH